VADLHHDSSQPARSVNAMAHDGDQYYAEDNFGGHRATGKVYVGSFLSVSAAAVLGCLLMSSAVKVCTE
jgi:hypothetical protein